MNIKTLEKKFKTNGYIKLKSFFSKNEIKIAKNKIDKYFGIKKKGTFWSPNDKDIFFLKLINKKKIRKILIKLLNDPYYQNLPKNKPNYILGEYIGINTPNPLHLHIDSWLPSKSSKTWMLQLGILLNDRNKVTGCTTYVKNSHTSDKYSDRKNLNISYLEGKEGDLIIWDSRLWHGRSKSLDHNLNSWILVATFQCWFLKQRLDYTKSTTKKLYKKMTKIEKQILGYCSIPPKNINEGFNPKRGYEIL